MHETVERPLLATRVNTIQAAVELSLRDLAEEAGWDPVFRFARALKAFEATCNMRLAKEDLSSAFSLWWNAAEEQLQPGADFEETRFLFFEAHQRARTPLGANPLEEAIRLARSRPLPAAALHYTSPKLQLLVAICYHLQLMAGDASFFLSARSAAKPLDRTTPLQALAFLTGLVRDDVLILVVKGKPGGNQASRFRFNPALMVPAKK